MQPPIHFCCLGPQRTASSWLHAVLSCHADVCLPRGVKETMFFDRRYAKGLDWYAWHFAQASSEQVRGEIAPTYFDSRDACQRLAELASELKLIVLVRHPVDRTFSLYRHHLAKGRLRVGFEQSLVERPELISSGKYSVHAAHWESFFAPDQFLYLWMDDVYSAPQDVVDQVCDFLGVSQIAVPEVRGEPVGSATAPRSALVARMLSSSATLLRSLRLHSLVNLGKATGLKKAFTGGPPVPPVSDATRERLLAEFEPDLAWLERRTGRDLSHWRLERKPAGR